MKKNFFKKTLAFTLASMMAFSMAPAVAFAAEDEEAAKAAETTEVEAAQDPVIIDRPDEGRNEETGDGREEGDGFQEELPPEDEDGEAKEEEPRNGDKYDIVSEVGEDGKTTTKLVEKEEAEENPDVERGIVVTPYAQQSSQVTVTPNATGDAVTDADKWSGFYNKEKGVFQLTYTIEDYGDNDADFLTLDLTYALKFLAEYAVECKTAANVIEPGDTIVFEFTIKSNSLSNYEYLPGSFVLQTPDLTNDSGNKSSVKSYDGQTLPEVYTDKTKYNIGLKTVPIKELLLEAGIVKDEYKVNLESLINKAIWLKDFNGSKGINDNTCGYQYDYRSEAFKAYNGDAEKYLLDYINNKYNKAYTDLGSAIEYYLCQYYGTNEGAEYNSYADLMSSNNAVKELFSDTGSNNPVSIGGEQYKIQLPANVKYNNYFKNLFSFVYGDDISDKTGDYKGQYTNSVRIYDGIVDSDDGKVYDGCIPASEIGPSVTQWTRYYGFPDDTLCWIDPDKGTVYFGFGDGNNGVRTASNSGEPTKTKLSSFNMYAYDSWSSGNHGKTAEYNRTVGDYMTRGSEAWNEAEKFLSKKFEGGIAWIEDETSAEIQAAAAAGQKVIKFLMGVNLDGQLTGNNYQNTFWGWYNAITLAKATTTNPSGGDDPPPTPPTPNKPYGGKDNPKYASVELDKSAATGDDMNMGMLLAMMGLSLAGGAVVLRKKNENEN